MDKFSIAIPVLKVRQKIGSFYIASVPAKTLCEISYSDIRRLAEEQRDVEKFLGIQRPISDKRIKELRQYVRGRDATFPSSVILAVDERCAVYDEDERGVGVLTLQPYDAQEGSDETSIDVKHIAKVLDGQHRIAAFLDEDKNWSFQFDNEEFDINVAIFVGADVSEQANIFATVNLAQTKVNKSLVYDLTELSKSPSPQKTCHNVAVMLDAHKESPLYKRIKRLGVATKGRQVSEPLTQAAFVESLIKFVSADPVNDRQRLLEGRKLPREELMALKKFPFRNLFIDGKDVDIAEIIYNYFSAVSDKWPNSWKAVDQKGNLLPRSNSFKALMKYLKDDVYPGLVVNQEFGRIPTKSEFSKYFAHIDLQDSDFIVQNFVPGSGGQSTFLKMLRGELKRSDLID